MIWEEAKKMIEFRDLTAEDCEVRVAQVTPSGVSLLIYKNSRVDMNILDETVGAENWQREHYDCKGNLYCRVGINTNFKNSELPDRWVWKSDCGAETKAEKEKGESSDSFKRACFNWGIGRELYTAPFIWVEAKDVKLEEYTQSGKKAYRCKDKFSVKALKIENKRITGLGIKNQRTNKWVFILKPEETKNNEV